LSKTGAWDAQASRAFSRLQGVPHSLQLYRKGWVSAPPKSPQQYQRTASHPNRPPSASFHS